MEASRQNNEYQPPQHSQDISWLEDEDEDEHEHEQEKKNRRRRRRKEKFWPNPTKFLNCDKVKILAVNDIYLFLMEPFKYMKNFEPTDPHAPTQS